MSPQASEPPELAAPAGAGGGEEQDNAGWERRREITRKGKVIASDVQAAIADVISGFLTKYHLYLSKSHQAEVRHHSAMHQREELISALHQSTMV